MHDICSHAQTKTEKYRELLPQLGSLIAADADLPTAVLANVCAVLKAQFGWWWVGFYLVDEARGELQLAPEDMAQTLREQLRQNAAEEQRKNEDFWQDVQNLLHPGRANNAP